ncbi:MAG: HAD-IIA family hydrolase [Anaerolineales bacterium]
MRGDASLDQRRYSLSQIDALILDIDGILYEGNRVLPGAVELIAHLNQERTPYLFLSNNTTYPFEHHVDKLFHLGVPHPQDSLLTAARITAQVVAAEAEPGACCFVIGEQGLIEALEQCGLLVTQSDYQSASYVVIGMDRRLTYDKLKGASLAIRAGAHFISSNPDPSYPDGEHVVPASGAVQAALEASTGRRARVTGKPALPGFRMALDILGSEIDRTGMLGDQPEIDIQGASSAGMRAFLVLSSLTPSYQPKNGSPQPDAVFESTLNFYQHWVQRNHNI